MVPLTGFAATEDGGILLLATAVRQGFATCNINGVLLLQTTGCLADTDSCVSCCRRLRGIFVAADSKGGFTAIDGQGVPILSMVCNRRGGYCLQNLLFLRHGVNPTVVICNSGP